MTSPAPLTSLPIRTELRRGEHIDFFIRRLAEANHLRPSILIHILHGPAGINSATISIDILAQLAGRPAQALLRTLSGLPQRHRSETESRPAPAARPGPDLVLPAIRASATENPTRSVRDLARQFGVRQFTVLDALDPFTQPPSKDSEARRISKANAVVLAVYADVIQANLDRLPHAPARQIWEHLVDEHGLDVPYRAVREYVSTRRTTSSRDVRRVPDLDPGGKP